MHVFINAGKRSELPGQTGGLRVPLREGVLGKNVRRGSSLFLGELLNFVSNITFKVKLYNAYVDTHIYVKHI